MSTQSEGLIILKTTLTILIFFFAVTGVLTPRLFNPFGTKISFANLIACGVIISAALVHLLSGAAANLMTAPLPKASGDKPYPWAYLICGLAFILLYFFERLLIHHFLHQKHHHHDHISKSGVTASTSFVSVSEPENKTEFIDVNVVNKHGHKHGQKHGQNHGAHGHKHNHGHGNCYNHNKHNSHKLAIPSKTERSQSTPLFDNNERSSHSPHHSHHHGVQHEHASDMLELLEEKNYFSAIILLLGLGLHSVLSGLALGSTQTYTQVITLGIAILSHKYLASFALGCPLYKSSAGKSFMFSICVAILFGLLTPIGIIIGWMLQYSFNMWISDIFICIASGTFLYVSICEIMIPEFSEEKKLEIKIYQSMSKINLKKNNDCTAEPCDNECKPKQDDNEDARKMLCVLFGFAIMSMLAIWI